MLSPRSHPRTISALGLAGVVGGSLVLATSGMAATLLPAAIDALPRGGSLEAGTATLKMSGGAKGRLASSGVKVTTSGSADVKGSSLEFQYDERTSLIDTTRMYGAVGTEGSVSFKGRKGTAKLTAITFGPGVDKNVTAKLGKRLIELGTLKGGSASFTRQSAEGTLKNARFALSGKAAKTLNAKTGGGFAAGSFGTLGLSVTARELPIQSGTATVTLDPAIVKTLNDSGFTFAAAPPATRSGDTITLALTAGAFDPEGLTGRLQLDGKITISGAVAGATRGIDLFGWHVAVTSSQKDLYANVNDGVAGVLGNVDLSGFTAQFEGSGFSAKGAKITLSKIATDIMRQQFGINVAVGTPLGTVDMAGELSGK